MCQSVVHAKTRAADDLGTSVADAARITDAGIRAVVRSTRMRETSTPGRSIDRTYGSRHPSRLSARPPKFGLAFWMAIALGAIAILLL